MDLASVVAALASVGVRVSGSTPNSSVQGDSSRACPTGFAGPEPSGTNIDPGQHFHRPIADQHRMQRTRKHSTTPQDAGQRTAPTAATDKAEGGLGWVGLGQGLIRTSRTMDVALPCASLLVRRPVGCPVARPAGLMTAPVPRGGTLWREMPPCLCVWGARAASACGAAAGGATRHVGSHGSAAPGPAPVPCVPLGGAPVWAQSFVQGSGGGLAPTCACPTLAQRGVCRLVGCH